MPSLLLPDADVIIGLHELGYWNQVVNSNKIYISSIVVGEVTHFWDSDGNKIEIDLSSQVSNGKVIQIEGSLQVQAEIVQKLKPAKLNGLDPGELESIAIIYEDKVEELKFCVRERPAIKAVAFLDLSDKAISVERVLRNFNIIKQNHYLPPINSQNRFEDIICDGKFLQIELGAKGS